MGRPHLLPKRSKSEHPPSIDRKKKPHKYKAHQYEIDGYGYEPVGESVMNNQAPTMKNPFLDTDTDEEVAQNDRNNSGKIYEDIEEPRDTIKAELNPFLESGSTPQYAVVDMGKAAKNRNKKE